MPRWFDLSEHGVALRLVSHSDGTHSLRLDPLSEATQVSDAAAQALGFEKDTGGHYVRNGSTMSAAQVRTVYPQVQLRDMARSEIAVTSAPTPVRAAKSTRPPPHGATLAAAKLSPTEFAQQVTFQKKDGAWHAAYQGERLDIGGASEIGLTRGSPTEKMIGEAHRHVVTTALRMDALAGSLASLSAYPKLAWPGSTSVGRSSEINVMRLLDKADLASKVMAGEDAHFTLQNEPYKDLVIERHGNKLMLTHYHRQNGDSWIDAEMVFKVDRARLWFVETATYMPFSGGEHRSKDRSFARMFSRNLLAQGFGEANVVDHRAPKVDPAPPLGHVQHDVNGMALAIGTHLVSNGWRARWTAGSITGAGFVTVEDLGHECPLHASAVDSMAWALADVKSRADDLRALGDPRFLGSKEDWDACVLGAEEKLQKLRAAQYDAGTHDEANDEQNSPQGLRH